MRWYSAMCVSTVPLFSWTWVLISFALSAYFSVFTVCSYCMLDPETVATITVLEFPHKPSLSILVSFESRKRHKHEPLLLPLPERVDAVRQRQQAPVDVRAVPQLLPAVVRLGGALRAREVHQRELRRRVRAPVVVPLRSRIQISKTAWLRELVAFAPVSSVFRRAFPCRSSSKISPSSRTLTCVSPATHGPFSGSSLSSSAGEWGTNKSYTSSLYTSVYEHSTPVVGALELAIVRDHPKRVAKAQHHQTRVNVVPHHRVRLPGARRAVREHRRVDPPENPANQRRDGFAIHRLVARVAVERRVEDVPPLLLTHPAGDDGARGGGGSASRGGADSRRVVRVFVLAGVHDADAPAVDELRHCARAAQGAPSWRGGRARTATRNVAWETPLRCNTRVNLCEASTSSAISSSVAAA